MSGPVVALFHTADVHVATFDRLFGEQTVDVTVQHTVRADLLADAEAAGGPTAEILAEAARAMADHALQSGASAGLCTCSTIAEAAELATLRAGIPFLRVDRALAEAAFTAGSRILIAACVPTTITPTLALFETVAGERGLDRDLRILLLEQAWPYFKDGNEEAYVTAIASGVFEAFAEQPCDAVVLAQASMAMAEPLLADLPAPVFSSPRPAVAAVLERIKKST